jgi:hypothetical protein
MIERLKMEDIFLPGYNPVVEEIDFDDPKNAHIKQAFEDTKMRQEALMALNEIDPSVWETVITI